MGGCQGWVRRLRGSFWNLGRLRGVILEGEEIEGGSFWPSEEIVGVILEGGA